MMSKVLEVTRSGYYKWLTMCDLLASKKSNKRKYD